MNWFEIVVSVLKRRKINVEFGENGYWDGDESKIMVEGQPLWDYIDSLGESPSEFLEDCNLLIVQHFDERVKSFVQNILLGPGVDKVPITRYTYRVEFQGSRYI